jgi:hypothetical protein
MKVCAEDFKTHVGFHSTSFENNGRGRSDVGRHFSFVSWMRGWCNGVEVISKMGRKYLIRQRNSESENLF